MERCSSIHRRTAETDIRVSLDLDGSGIYTLHTGISFSRPYAQHGSAARVL